MSVLLVIGCVFAVLAAVVHGYIFVLESVRWTHPSTWRVFGLHDQAEAETTRSLAFNQGFYNLFLGIGAAVGVTLIGFGAASTGAMDAGAAVTLFALACMLAAALVLIISSPKLARSAVVQGAAPLIGIVLLAVGLAA